MGLDSLLIHQATVQRSTAVLDAYGNASLTWYDYDSVPCRLVEKRERIWSNERAESVVVTRYLLLVPAGTEVQERDRVQVDGVTYTVGAVLTRNTRATHHKSLSLEVVS